MKVLKSKKSFGNKKTKWKQLVECKNNECNAILEVAAGDVFRRHHSYPDDTWTDYHVVCPVCTHSVDILDVPEEIKKLARDWNEWIKKNRGSLKPTHFSIRTILDFPKAGILFKDIAPLLAKPVEAKRLTEHMSKQWQGKIDSIGGFDARGFIFGAMLAYEMELPFFMLRKKGKLPGKCKVVSYDLEYGSASLEIQVGAVKRGARVLLIDDLLATGGTALAGCKLVESLGGKVAGLQFVIELKDLSGRQALDSYEAYSVITC
jgi:adenine phosphoribosyltransferase